MIAYLVAATLLLGPVTNVTYNWAGYEVLSQDNHHYFRQVEGSWTVMNVPDRFDSEGNVVSQVTTWVGLGGDLTNNPRSTVLWQAGTEFDTLGRAIFFYEDYGCHNPCPNGGRPIASWYPRISPGDRVFVRASTDGTVYLDDLSTNQSVTRHVSIDNNHVGLSAEWIAEETCDDVESGGCDEYLPFSEALQGRADGRYVDAYRYRRVQLLAWDGSLASVPGPLQGHAFRVGCCR